MKRRLGKLFHKFLFLVTLGLFLFILAAPAGAAGDQETIALNFLKFLRSDKAILSAEILEGNRLDPALVPVIVAHLFHLKGGGYLLVSADRSISPVKAYSLVGDFAALPPTYRQALLAELELRARVALAGTGRAPLEAGMTETEARWDFLLRLDTGRMPLEYTAGTYLLQTKWNQTYPYNKFLPQVGDQTVVAGCVNVALAQAMRYYGYPASSKGVVSYTWTPPAPQPPELLKTILYRSYNWANMPETVDAATPEYQTDEVALLLKDLGIANRTAFDAGGSSTSLDTRMVMENFGYSTGLSERGNGPDPAAFNTFLTTLKEEIAAERPVLLAFKFPGHMVVVDGYSAYSDGRKIHLNMGWGGAADEFYFLDAPVKAGTYEFAIDAEKLDIYYKIKPCNTAAGDCAVNLEAGDGIDGLAIAGSFNQAKDADLNTVFRDADLYEVYLKGPTTISATRGYSTVGFFVSIISAEDGSVVFSLPDTLAINNPPAAVSVGNQTDGLSAGKYIIRAALCNAEGTSCYPLGLDHYTVTLTSGTLLAEERTAIDLGLEKAPVIENAFPDLILNTASGTREFLIDARDENGDPVLLSVKNSNTAAVGAVLNGNILELTPTGAAKVSSRIVVTATANGKTTEKSFIVLTDDSETAFGKSYTVGGIFAGQDDVKPTRRSSTARVRLWETASGIVIRVSFPR